MKLLTVGSLPPEWGGPVRGGAATFHAALLEELLRDGRGVEVAGVIPPGPLDREIPVPAFVRPEGMLRAAFYEQVLDRVQPDIVLMNHFAHTIGATHARLGSPAPAVGVAQSWHNITFRTGAERERARELTQEALDGLSALVPVSRHMLSEKQLDIAYAISAEVIHNPVPPRYMEDAPRRERAGVVFLGSLIPRKAPGALVEVAALLPGLSALLIGEGEEEDELRARIAALGLGDRVRLAEAPGGDDHVPWVRERLSGAEAMCLPSRSEGLPLAFVEALACGTPIVGFGPAVREIRDELGIDVGEPLETGAPEEVAAALERVLAGEWDRGELRRATLAHFGLDRVVDRYVNLFDRVAGCAPALPAVARPRRTAPRAYPAAPDGTAICVLGPSRSGTSLSTRLLASAGVYLGPAAELLGEDLSQLAGEGERVLAKARRSNPGGHWEHYRLMRLNERILRTLGDSWREPPALAPGWEASRELDEIREEAGAILAESFAGHGLWGWKDPRNALTLPFWRALLPQMRCVICLRDPLEVAASLRERDGIEIEAGVAHWARYMAAALVNSAGQPRLVVGYESYFQDATGAARRLARFVGRPAAFDGAGGESLAAEAIDESLWRSRRPAASNGRRTAAPSSAAALFRVGQLLAAAGEGGDRADLHAAADVYAGGVLAQLDPTVASQQTS